MSAPLIISTNPTNGGTEQYLNVHLEIAFNQAMLESSLNANTILLYRSTDYQQVEGMITYDSSNYTITFIPVKSLDESSGYTLIIVGADQSVDCIKNALSENLATSGLVQFTTGSEIYEPPQEEEPSPVSPDEEIAPSPTVPVLEPAVSLDFCVTDTNPDHRQTNVGSPLPSGWENVESPGGRVYIPEPSGSSSIYVTFSQDLWSSGIAYLDWLTVEATSVNGDPMFPSSVPSGYILPPSGNTLYWTTPYSSDWWQNNEITVTISKEVISASGDYLGEAQQFMFTTAYNPLYCSVQKIRMAIGPYIREVPDDTINRTIFNNSLLAYQLANETYGQNQWGIEDPSFAAKMYACCKTQYDLMNAELLNRIGGAGQLKRLGDFTVQDQLDLSKAMRPAMDQAESCMAFWVDRLVGKTGKAHPKMAIKGISNSATPPMRGVRTWTRTVPGMSIPAANTRTQRSLKLPSIYSRWS